MLCLSDAADAWPKLGGVGSLLETLLGWTLPVYTVLAMRRVFRRGWPGTLVKGVALFFVYLDRIRPHRGRRIRVLGLAAVRSELSTRRSA